MEGRAAGAAFQSLTRRPDRPVRGCRAARSPPAAQLQPLVGGEARALDMRAFGSFSRGRWSAHASAERGRDVADDTLLARRLYSSSEFGLAGAIGGWKLSVRGGRFTRAQQLTAGTAHFLREFDPFDAGYGQWTLHVRPSRAWRWPVAADSPGPAWAPIAPLVGSISGRVWSGPAEAAAPMEGVWVLVGDCEARLEPGGRRTASWRDGTWAFRGLSSGDYAVEVDRTTAPGLAWRWGHAALVALEPGAELPGIVFEVSAGR